MSRLHPLLLLASLCLLAAPALRSTEPAATLPISATDLLKIHQLESPALSPDGKHVVYVVRSIVPKPGTGDDWIYQSQLWLARTDGATPPRQLTFDAARSSHPVWSPDGTRIAFVRTADKAKPQIYLLPVSGGEAAPLTKLETGASHPRWSPDGSRLVFTSTLNYAQIRAALEKAGKDTSPAWNREKPGRTANDTDNWRDKARDTGKPEASPDGTLQQRREWLARNEADANPRVTTRLNFLAEGDLAPEPEFTQLYVIEARDGAAPKAVAPGYASYTSPAWLHDGQTLVCLGPRDPTQHPDRDRLNSLYALDAATGAAQTLLAEPGCTYAEPAPSPDGKWIACTVRSGGEFSFEQPKVVILPAGGGAPTVLTPDLDRTAGNLAWSPDSRFIYFIAPDRGRFPLYRVAADGGEVQRLTEQPDWGIRDYAIGQDALTQIVTNPLNPYELHIASPDGKSTRPLSSHNASWLQDRKLSAYEGHRLVQADGITVDYWTLKPVDFDPAKKYPLLVQIHGGPSAMWGPGEASMWHEFQFYAARGYVVMFANPRGSGGYGRDFQRANYRDWGTGPASDVLAAATFTAKEHWIDRSRQVLTGGSYGGYLTAWIVAHDHRFKAAVAQRGVYDLATFFGEGNAWFLVPLYWGGYPWEPKIRPLLARDSPLTYAADIRTPLLIQHGDVDFRTGVIQSQMLYKTLKQLGRDVEYVRYPRATHELSRSGEPKQRLDTLVRYEEFFRRHIGEN